MFPIDSVRTTCKKKKQMLTRFQLICYQNNQMLNILNAHVVKTNKIATLFFFEIYIYWDSQFERMTCSFFSYDFYLKFDMKMNFNSNIVQ